MLHQRRHLRRTCRAEIGCRRKERKASRILSLNFQLLGALKRPAATVRDHGGSGGGSTITCCKSLLHFFHLRLSGSLAEMEEAFLEWN
jgi:hypothetical protein